MKLLSIEDLEDLVNSQTHQFSNVGDIEDNQYEKNKQIATILFLNGNENYSFSTGICDSVTAGYGRCDEYGYFEYPLRVCQESSRIHEYPNTSLNGWIVLGNLLSKDGYTIETAVGLSILSNDSTKNQIEFTNIEDAVVCFNIGYVDPDILDESNYEYGDEI